ncbi:Repulsive guidance molecule A like protein [Argiope bruennichi]|uniref:Repulsive guidance molecule A like protein n=1 Tax=Argiope bruennichi TaxID=94029 RepID=A0A8T0EFJ7_ARGBR|nr:Repulsive guidance molecule A like protein [Argiope bruennichi]
MNCCPWYFASAPTEVGRKQTTSQEGPCTNEERALDKQIPRADLWNFVGLLNRVYYYRKMSMGWAVMGRGYSGGPANAPSVLLQLLIIVCSSSLVYSAECRVQLCSRQYARATEEDNIQQGATFRYCSLLRSYSDCVRATARSCRGDLSYHTVQSLVSQWMRMFDCTRVLEKGPQAMPPPKHPSRPGGGHRFQKPPHQECNNYRPVGGYSHCALFGDPHLRTFYDELQTCSVPGAWPLLDNPHVAVQVTNEPVGKGSVATAITKVTVIIVKCSVP